MDWTRIALDDSSFVDLGTTETPDFETLWASHPHDFTVLKLYGRPVPIPRWQQAYGQDYRFSGQVTHATPIPPLLAPSLAWARTVDPRINGLLLNWYDGAHRHRIGPHRDSPIGLVAGAPILTVSLGDPRCFRLRAYRGDRKVDLEVVHGTVVAIPWDTNQRWTHEVLHRARDVGRRISITARAFTHGRDQATT